MHHDHAAKPEDNGGHPLWKSLARAYHLLTEATNHLQIPTDVGDVDTRLRIEEAFALSYQAAERIRCLVDETQLADLLLQRTRCQARDDGAII